MIALDTELNNENFGRIATFTWPELSHEDLDVVRKEANIRTAYPRVGPETAFSSAIKEFDGTVESGKRFFSRTINSRTVEFISEIIVPQADGDIRGERETLVKAVVGAGDVKFEAYHERGMGFIELFGDSIRERVTYHMAHVSAGLVSEWAERVVVREFGGFSLANRGHSIHVRGAGVAGFDRFMGAMGAVSRGAERVQVFKTVDTDPASMASLLSSIRARVVEAIESGERRAVVAKTSRGINGVVDGLISVRAQIESYRDLLGDELDAFVASLERAADAVSSAEIVKSFGGLS